MDVTLTYRFDTMDELRAYLELNPAPTERTETPAPAAPAAPAPAETPAPAAPAEAEVKTDADGMPHDPEFHSDPPSFTADGLWRAKRGKADEARAAREAFKSGGGSVEPPAGLPGLGAAVQDEPEDEPVSFDRMVEKITGMLKRGKIVNEDLPGFYTKATGVDLNSSVKVLETNETARASLFAALCDIEPEL